MNKPEKKIFYKLIDKYYKNNKKFYPLVKDPFLKEDLICGLEPILRGKITMSELTKKFEHAFAKKLGAKFALMVNSGSSANLLALQTLVNPRNNFLLDHKQECLIPSLCWSTSLWPIVQSGLKPIFVDINSNTLNIDCNLIEKKITKNTKAIVAVHVLGNSTNIEKLEHIVKKYNLTLIEDTCEALGSKYNSKFLGTFGRFGTFSFFVSHQISAGEGGMIVFNNKKDYQIAKTLRAHGWTRDLSKKNYRKFDFINSGFNLRPLDVTAAIAYNQFKRLNKTIKIRSLNRDNILKSIKNSPDWNNQLEFLSPIEKLKPSWFGIPILINKKLLKKKKKYLNFLNQNGIETRPIISGNFLNQPSIRLYKLNKNNEKFKASQDVEDRGFFIGLNSKKIEKKEIEKLTNLLLNLK